MRFRPTVEEERRIALAGRAKRWQRAGLVTPDERVAIEEGGRTGWKVSPLLLRIGVFVLTFLALWAAAAFAFALLRAAFDESVLHRIVGLVAYGSALAAAEHMIARWRWLRTGAEEALWSGGVLGMTFVSLSFFEPFAFAGSELVWSTAFGGALVAAGARLLNPLFALAGIAAAIFGFAVFTGSESATAALVALLSVAAAAVLTGEVRRPWIEGAAAWIAALGPAVTWLVLRIEQPLLAAIVGIAAMAGWMAAGIARRSRVLLSGAAVVGALLAGDALLALPWPAESRLLAGGAAAFGLAIALERWLRTPRRGFTSHAIDREGFGALAELGAVSLIAPAAPLPSRESGGGFGGAGASGEY